MFVSLLLWYEIIHAALCSATRASSQQIKQVHLQLLFIPPRASCIRNCNTTALDDSKHKYWLARIEQCAWVLPSAYVCSSSGDKFDEGARVLKVTYFNREGGDRIFRHREDLGTFTICSSLLRKHKIALPEINGRGRRHALPLCDLSFEIGEQLDREIKTTIMHVFQDD